MILNLHYRVKREYSTGARILIDFLDKVPLIGVIARTLIKRHDLEPYTLNLDLDKIKTEMLIEDRVGNNKSEMRFSELKEVVYDYNRKHEGVTFFPTMATFYSQNKLNFVRVPLSKRSDYKTLKETLSSMDVQQRNNINLQVVYILFGAIVLGIVASIYLAPILFNLLMTYIIEN